MKTVLFADGRLRAKRIFSIIYLVIFPKINWKGLKKAPSVSIMSSKGTDIKLVMEIDLIISTISLYPHLASLII